MKKFKEFYGRISNPKTPADWIARCETQHRKPCHLYPEDPYEEFDKFMEYMRKSPEFFKVASNTPDSDVSTGQGFFVKNPNHFFFTVKDRKEIRIWVDDDR